MSNENCNNLNQIITSDQYLVVNGPRGASVAVALISIVFKNAENLNSILLQLRENTLSSSNEYRSFGEGGWGERKNKKGIIHSAICVETSLEYYETLTRLIYDVEDDKISIVGLDNAPSITTQLFYLTCNKQRTSVSFHFLSLFRW